MSGFFILELDTTAPSLEIYAPNYTTNHTEMDITVFADEPLSSEFQNFYIVDGYGKKESYIFTHTGKAFEGKITLSNFDNGLVTFYAQVMDSVGNVSQLASKVIQVIPSVNYLRMSIEDRIVARELNMLMLERNTSSDISDRIISLLEVEGRSLVISKSDRDMSINSESDETEIETEVVAE